MKFLPHLIQGSKEWLDYRRFRIGASEVSAILGIDPYCTRLELWTKKLMCFENKTNDAMRRGSSLEPVVRNMHNEQEGLNYEPACIEHEDLPYLFCSLDGWDANAEPKIIEIKCLKKEHHELARDGQILNHYMAQLQHQMLVTGEKAVKYLSYHNGEILQRVFEANPLYQERILTECQNFYRELMDCIPPQETERDIEVLHSEDAIGHIKAYDYAKQQREIWEEAEKRAKECVLNLCNSNKNKIQIDDWMISKVVRRGNIDYEAIEVLKCVDLENYRKPASTSYRLIRTNV